MKTTQIFSTAVLLILFQCIAYSQNRDFVELDILQFSEEKLLSNDYLLLIHQKITKGNIERRSDNLLFLDSLVFPNGNANLISYDDQNRVRDYQSRGSDYILGELGFAYVEDSEQIDFMVQVGYPGPNQPADFFAEYNYSYNTDGLVSEIIVTRETSTGQEISREVIRYSYEENGELISAVSIDIDQNGNESEREVAEYFYDEFSKLDSIKNYEINSNTNSARLYSSEYFTYDESDNLILKMLTFETFTLVTTEEMTYDSLGNVLSLYRTVNSSDSNTEFLREYEYNYDISPDDLVSHFSSWNQTIFASTLTHKNQLLRSIFYSDGSEAVIRTFYWSDRGLNTATSTSRIESIKVYPNPVFAQLQFQNLEISTELKLAVFDVLGRRVLNDIVSTSNQQIGVSALVKGNYFYKLEDAEQVLYSGRFVKSEN